MSASPSPEAAHGVWQFSSSSPVVSLDSIKISNGGNWHWDQTSSAF
jgi:hypothetical protein